MSVSLEPNKIKRTTVAGSNIKKKKKTSLRFTFKISYLNTTYCMYQTSSKDANTRLVWAWDSRKINIF